MNKFDRIRVRGTEVTGTIIDIEAKRERSANKILYITVALDNGNIQVYDVSELKVINTL